VSPCAAASPDTTNSGELVLSPITATATTTGEAPARWRAAGAHDKLVDRDVSSAGQRRQFGIRGRTFHQVPDPRPHQPDRGRLPRAVQTQQGVNVTGVDPQADAVHRGGPGLRRSGSGRAAPNQVPPADIVVSGVPGRLVGVVATRRPEVTVSAARATCCCSCPGA
jgi:hypothetical protein